MRAACFCLWREEKERNGGSIPARDLKTKTIVISRCKKGIREPANNANQRQAHEMKLQLSAWRQLQVELIVQWHFEIIDAGARIFRSHVSIVSSGMNAILRHLSRQGNSSGIG